jgi:glycerol-3-phosphate acyltransferase PlsX
VEQPTLKIAVDAMGGDFAPENEVAGALEALRETQNRFEVVLIGQEEKIHASLRKHRNVNDCAYSIVNASEVIDMNDTPTVALRTKKNSSLVVGLTKHKEHQIDAFVSAGNTGAVMTASTLILGRIEGVSRPTIGTFLPNESGVCILLDAGANMDCKPHHLLDFAIMGSMYARYIFHCENPKVALLNVGEEDSKGDDLAKETFQLLSDSTLNFIGNVEGRDILKGKAEVVVCDGFVGNVVLKFAESVLGLLKKKLRDYAAKGFFHKLRVGLMTGTLRTVLKEFDYQEYGGVPLLGVNGVTIIGHGKSTPKAIKNMILKAEEMVQKRVNEHIREALAQRKVLEAVA